MSDATPLRAGIVGGGAISETHARAARAAGLEVVAVQGRNTARVAALADAFDATAYAELDALLRHRPLDLVLVGSPSALHAEQGIAAAAQGLHVLMEKPLDVSTARADALIEACERAGVGLGVFFQDRTAPGIRWLKRLLEGGGLGRPLLASARVRWYRPPEYFAPPRRRGTWALDGGGAVMAQGIHTLDLLLHLLGDVRRVRADMRTALHTIEVEDTATALLEFEGGILATYEATTAAYPGYPRRLELSGSEGTVIVEGDRVVAVDLKTPPAEPPPEREGTHNPSASSPLVSDPAGHRAIVEDFVQAMRTGRRSLCDGREGRRSVALVEAIYGAARTGEAVTLLGG